MTIDVRKHGEICIFEFRGELGFGPATALLSKTSKQAIENGERHFLFDMRQVPWLDSSGLGEVVACHKRARAAKGVVKLVLQERSRSVFTVTHLEKMFEMFDDLEPAIESFAGPDGGYKARF